ncbi:toxin Cry1Ac domain D-VI-related protein [Enterococcus faecalis]|uniref:toxin Cry1Ac domain D-VI-related protein n=1 Tax=Enterococcus faecalis TaxID=1351 RepID=UPI002DB712AA|nr:toxin Cry1Ac domain D-VI-related protein [Enterococcus faecalis]MEB8146397.1 toxin Cry1Ac domain D-VI-related protein [Enterococcus faecalis]
MKTTIIKVEYRRALAGVFRNTMRVTIFLAVISIFFKTVSVFGKDQIMALETELKNTTIFNKTQSSIDPKIYQNLLKNPTLQVNGTILTDWTIRPGGKGLNVISTEIGLLSIKDSGFKLTFSDNRYNEKPMYLKYEDNNLIKLQYENFSVEGVLVTLTFQQQVQTIENRTYVAEIRASGKSKSPYLGVNFDNKIGYEGNDPYYRTKEIKNSSRSQVVTYYMSDSHGDPIYLIRDSLSVKMKYANQWRRIDALFTSLEQTDLAPGVTIRDIDKAEAKVDCLEENNDIKEMTHALDKARSMFEKKTVDAVNALITNGQLGSGISQESIVQTQALISQLPEGTQKQALQNQLNQAKELWEKQKQAQIAIEDLFQNGHLKPTVSQEKFKQVQQLLDVLPVGESKQMLQQQLDYAKELWEKQKQAQTAMENLFQNGQLKPIIPKEEINQAQELINKLPETGLKNTLQNKLNYVQKIYDQRVSTEINITLNGFFSDTTYFSLEDNVTSEDLNKIFVKLMELPENYYTDRLALRLAFAQVLLNNRKINMAIKDKVDHLFADTTYKQLAAGITCEQILTVQVSVLSLTDITLRNELKLLIEKALSLC